MDKLTMVLISSGFVIVSSVIFQNLWRRGKTQCRALRRASKEKIGENIRSTFEKRDDKSLS
ncbi:MAG: hypothetical protein REV36_02560 [Burkholderia sp.]|nr:hypothetical protein [Burkholderia sp.]